MTDAMRAARDRWLANPDSAGAGAAFEAGWYARGQPHAGLIADDTRLAEATRRLGAAIDLAVQYGQIDGARHKAWVIDQMVRVLAGDHYPLIVRMHNVGTDGWDTYSWDVGIAP